MMASPLLPGTGTPPGLLVSLLNRKLRVTTTDTRVFVGQLKCTDRDRNVILALTHEYRVPPPPSLSSLPPASLKSAAVVEGEFDRGEGSEAGGVTAEIAGRGETVWVDMTSRFLGLVVVPGRYITKIEVEERE
ncbi:MAG: hypothetical protein M1825_005170 [Sarcosagium campestre]|nr:MAG: hypothetical protein M1825_005170 [Sarcosagium campestre]